LVDSLELGILGGDGDPVGFGEEGDFGDVEFWEGFEAAIEIGGLLSEGDEVFNKRGST
jgi:hypothetical protein